MNEDEAIEVLEEALTSLQEDYSYEHQVDFQDIKSAGYLTNDKGLEVRINGEKFLFTVQKVG